MSVLRVTFINEIFIERQHRFVDRLQKFLVWRPTMNFPRSISDHWWLRYRARLRSAPRKLVWSCDRRIPKNDVWNHSIRKLFYKKRFQLLLGNVRFKLCQHYRMKAGVPKPLIGIG